jgi:hypothetical protein
MRTLDYTKCIVCDLDASGGVVGEGVAAIPCCEACWSAGKFQAWADRGGQRWRESGIAIESSGNFALDLREVDAYLRSDARIADGICPNGCALMVRLYPDSDRHALCPACGFQGFQSSPYGFLKDV